MYVIDADTDLPDRRTAAANYRLAAAKGVTMAQLIRDAVDEDLDDEPDPDATLTSTFGADPTASAPSRDSWQRG